MKRQATSCLGSKEGGGWRRLQPLRTRQRPAAPARAARQQRRANLAGLVTAVCVCADGAGVHIWGVGAGWVQMTAALHRPFHSPRSNNRAAPVQRRQHIHASNIYVYINIQYIHMASWKMDVVESNSQRMRCNDNQAIFSSTQPGFAEPVHDITSVFLHILATIIDP